MSCLNWLCAQTPGEWTWMSGTKYTNTTGIFDTMGVSSPLSTPPGLYEATEWTDKEGNFWIYGGETSYHWSDDLWKYDVSTNLWTWVKGSGGLPDRKPIYGIQGIPSPINSPGERCMSQSWTDSEGNLWLFGGASYKGVGIGCAYNDLWKYSIVTNMWTWMKGDSVHLCGDLGGHYGIKNVESTLNNPRHQVERDITWSENDNLWMLDYKGCLWKYRITTNNWIWVKGDTNGITVYGQKGIPAIDNTPGANYFSFTRWKDSNNNFWYFYAGNDYGYKDIFKYNISSNMWTWIWGNGIPNDTASHYSDTLCDNTYEEQNENVIPFSRCEARACWIDECNNLWLMGGWGDDHSTHGDFNDLIYFDTDKLKWVWVGNDTTHNYDHNYGTMGVSSPLNKPGSRSGALPFKDKFGNLWVYGGAISAAFKYYGDLWRFELDNGCSLCDDSYQGHVLSQESLSDSIIVYPNPAIDEVIIEMSSTMNCQFDLYNVIGAKIFTITFDHIKKSKIIDLRNICSGAYIYIIKDEMGNQLKKDKLIISK